MLRDLNDKIEGVRCSFAPLMQRPLGWIETAELLHDDDAWDSWHDLPVRLFVNRDVVVSIAWNGFDDLWLATDLSLPFSLEDANVRWSPMEGECHFLMEGFARTIDPFRSDWTRRNVN